MRASWPTGEFETEDERLEEADRRLWCEFEKRVGVAVSQPGDSATGPRTVSLSELE